jgi:hypothetical protein
MAAKASAAKAKPATKASPAKAAGPSSDAGRTAAKAKPAGDDWISGAVSKRPGQLHRDLNIPVDQKIPAATLNEAAKQPGKGGQRARLAKTLGRINK